MKKMNSNNTPNISIGVSKCTVVQKKSTPFKKPKNKGGSPSGVNAPPIFATKNIKNIIICVLCFRNLFALIKGRISNIAAPVVPIQEANKKPIKRNKEFILGVPTKLPFILMPPEITKRAPISIINGMYSSNTTCNSSYSAASL